MTYSVNRNYIPEVDQLRAFAALLVLFYHGFQYIGAQIIYGEQFAVMKHWVYTDNPFIAVIAEGHTGVGLFIVLSGFILSLGAVGNTVNYKSFVVARILRIYPMLIACVVLSAASVPNNILGVLTSLLPVNVSGGIAGGFGGMLWAVAIEFQCYLLFPFLILFSNEKGSRFLWQVLLTVLALRALAVFGAHANPRDISYWNVVGRLDQFCLGMIAARLYVARGWDRRLSAWWLLPAAVNAVLVLWAFNWLGGWPVVRLWKIVWPDIEGLMWAFFIITYIAAGRHLPQAIAWIVTKLGEISYSFYLLQFPVLFVVIQAGLFLRPTGNGLHDALVTTAVVVLPLLAWISALTYYTIEVPFLRLRPNYIVRKDAESASRAAVRLER